MFVYCGNNPANSVDESGTFWQELKAFGRGCLNLAIAVGAITVAGAAVIGAAVLTVGSGGAGAVALPAAAVVVAESIAIAVTAITAIGVVSVTAGEIGSNIQRKQTSRNQMQKQVENGQAPGEIDRVDPPHTNAPNQQSHVHFKDGTAMNLDGSPSHGSRGVPKLTRPIIEWFAKNGYHFEVK